VLLESGCSSMPAIVTATRIAGVDLDEEVTPLSRPAKAGLVPPFEGGTQLDEIRRGAGGPAGRLAAWQAKHGVECDVLVEGVDVRFVGSDSGFGVEAD
jgi:hypothetical protein